MCSCMSLQAVHRRRHVFRRCGREVERQIAECLGDIVPVAGDGSPRQEDLWRARGGWARQAKRDRAHRDTYLDHDQQDGMYEAAGVHEHDDADRVAVLEILRDMRIGADEECDKAARDDKFSDGEVVWKV